MEEFKNKGVYCIINKINNRMYVGSSTNFGSRRDKHFSLLRHNKHQNYLLQTDVNQFGMENFSFDVLKYCQIDLKNEEQYFFNQLNPYYNITKDAIRNTPSEESRRKMSETRLKMYQEGLQPNGAKAIVQYNLQHEFINEFRSIRQASIQLNIAKSSIHRVLNGTYKQMKGFIFHYKTDLLKSCELLENPGEDNQQPSFVEIH